MEEIARFSRRFAAKAALVHGKRQLSYQQLDQSADKFAGYLVQRGVQPGDAVALCMERSFDWIVAALGIWRAGATYVPLDCSWPDARISSAIKDAGVAALIARSDVLARLDETKAPVSGIVCIDPAIDATRIESAPAIRPQVASLDQLAYIIYTSGSAGAPKGVEITHGNLGHVLDWHRRTFHVTPKDRVSHLLGMGFDAAVLEIWGHLSAGATLYLADEEVRWSAELMQQWIVRQQITIALVPTVHGAKLMNMEWPSSTALRLLITGGDALRRGPVKALPFEVVNHYGPTECTIVSTYSVLRAGSADAPSIGWPIQGVSIYLLSEEGQPVLNGEVGEIYIGGPGVGRGYRNLPHLTSRCFLPDPFAAPGGRMYRSGDEARRREDGQLEFRGRLDHLTKIRGFRIELEEVSGTLNAHPGIEFAIVVARAIEETHQLIAYVLPAEADPRETELTVEALQEYLSRTLPDYMVPSAFIQLNALPLTGNGKIDLAALPDPRTGSRLPRRRRSKPADSETISLTEPKLLAMVREVLNDLTIGAEDNFFLAGGHSLIGAQLVTRLNNELGSHVTLSDLFGAPSARRLAHLLDTPLRQKCIARIWAEVLAMRDVGLDDDFFNLGGHAEYILTIQRRIAEDLGVELPIDRLLCSTTVRKQAELLNNEQASHRVLPPGVLALQPQGDRNPIFWVHYFSMHLARSIGDFQPFLVVRLMAEDFPALSPSPSLQEIANCHLRKILEAQPVGPYVLGGLCLGGILAYEIAQQLRAQGHDVSLLIMLDTPSAMEMLSPKQMRSRLSEFSYLWRRALGFGPRESLARIGARAKRFFTPRKEQPLNEIDQVQEVVAAAASFYQPQRYDGEVLLLLASERPPHLDFLSGWQQLLGHNLRARYIQGHHTDLTNGPAVPFVVQAIHEHPVMQPALSHMSISAV